MTAVRTTSRGILVSLLAAAVLFQGPIAAAADPTPVATQDVRLREGGILLTRVVDLQGKPMADEEVVVEFRGKPIASGFSNDKGLVAISGLRAGQHSLVTRTGATVCRLWMPETAPPSAVNTPAVVSDSTLVRGQFGAFNLPMLVYAGVAAAALVIGVSARNDAQDAESAARQAQSQNEELSKELSDLTNRVEELEKAVSP
jgi:hypothetical protein